MDFKHGPVLKISEHAAILSQVDSKTGRDHVFS